jgi:hypothetical protein
MRQPSFPQGIGELIPDEVIGRCFAEVRNLSTNAAEQDPQLAEAVETVSRAREYFRQPAAALDYQAIVEEVRPAQTALAASEHGRLPAVRLALLMAMLAVKGCSVESQGEDSDFSLHDLSAPSEVNIRP